MLHDRYEIIKVIGKGGWGEVSQATDAETGHSVAIKSLRLEQTGMAGSIDKEIESLSLLDHPGVVKYYDSFIEGDSVHIIMEFVEGETLETIRQKSRLPLSKVAGYVRQLLQSLDHIHSRGIIHSDLKPENIIIDPDDKVRIIDFGIVRTASAELAADLKDIRGTLHYMSPEQAEGNPIDIRSDLFSLGVIVYELCCGVKPFSGDYDMAVIYSILYEEPVPPDRVNAEVHPDLSRAIMQLLAKNPDDRPASAIQVEKILPVKFSSEGKTTNGEHRIAILPFQVPSDDEESRLIADGLKDELYARFKQLENIEVASPIKVARHRENLTDGAAFRTLLGVDDYLTGSVSSIGSRLRIYLMLISTSDEAVLWSDKFDSPMTDLFDVIDNITAKVMDKVEARLMGKAELAAPTSSTTSPEAYELYLLARGYYVKNTEQDLNYARKMFLEALKLDPGYALAQVGIADCYCATYMNYSDRRREVIDQATEWAEKALALVPNLPEAYRTLGRIMQITGRVKEASTYFLKAVTYKEDYYLAYRSLGWLAKDCYRYDEALSWVRKTLSINSIDLETIFLKGVIHFERKESKQAINDFTRCLELRPDYGRAHLFQGMTFFQLGRIDEAIESLLQAVRWGGDINAPYLLGYYYLCKGEYLKGIDVLLEAVTKPEIAFIAWFNLGIARILIDERDEAELCFINARDQSRQLLAKVPDLHLAAGILAGACALLGEKEECLALVKNLEPHITFDGSVAHELARIYAILGDKEQCRRYLEIAVENHQGPTEKEIEIDPILKYYLENGPNYE